MLCMCCGSSLVVIHAFKVHFVSDTMGSALGTRFKNTLRDVKFMFLTEEQQEQLKINRETKRLLKLEEENKNNNNKPVTIFFFGLHEAGKTTLLYRLKLGEVVKTVSTVGLGSHYLDIDGMRTVVMDGAFRSKSRPLFQIHMTGVDALLFVIDSTDRERLTEAVDDFFELVNIVVQQNQLPVLVLANKQDQDAVLSPEEIKKAIYEKGGEAFRVNTALEVFPTVVLTLEGVSPALDWLKSQLALRIAHRLPASFLKSA